MIDDILCSCEDSLQCGFLHVLSDAVLRKKLTIHTFERFLSCMYSHMHFQIRFLYKSSITLGTAVRLFSVVGPCMYSTFKLCFIENALPHFIHLKGFSPVWDFICITRLPISNVLPHSVHVYAFSIVCVYMKCLFRCFPLVVKVFHIPHICKVSLLYVFTHALSDFICQ